MKAAYEFKPRPGIRNETVSQKTRYNRRTNKEVNKSPQSQTPQKAYCISLSGIQNGGVYGETFLLGGHVVGVGCPCVCVPFSFLPLIKSPVFSHKSPVVMTLPDPDPLSCTLLVNE